METVIKFRLARHGAPVMVVTTTVPLEGSEDDIMRRVTDAASKAAATVLAESRDQRSY